MILSSALLLGDDGSGTGGFVGGSDDILLPNFPLNFYFTKAAYLEGVVALNDNVYVAKEIVNPNAFPIHVTSNRAWLQIPSGQIYSNIPVPPAAWNWKNRKGGTSGPEVGWFDLPGVEFNAVANFFGSNEDIKCAFKYRRLAGGVDGLNALNHFIAGGGSLTVTLALYRGNKSVPFIMPAITETLHGQWFPWLPGYNVLSYSGGFGDPVGSRFLLNGTAAMPGAGVVTRSDISFDSATDEVTATVIPMTANYYNGTATEVFTPLLHAPCRFTGSGSLPAPLLKDVTYYMEPTGAGTFKLRTAPDPDLATINLSSSSTSGTIRMLCSLPGGGAASLLTGDIFRYGWQANAIKEDFR